MSGNVRMIESHGVLHIQFDRPSKKNALTQEMYTAVSDGFDRASADPSIRVVVLSGSKTCFTSGNDVADFLSGGVDLDSPVFRFLKAISQFAKPIVAAVAGPAIGVGTTMLFHCDLVYATADIKLKTPFVDLALVPEAGSSLLMPRTMGYQRAAGMLLLGESLDAEGALNAGVINAIVPTEELLSVALKKAARLAAKPPTALRLSKSLMKRATNDEVQERIGLEGTLFAESLSSPEAKEALSAFLEGRAPDFSKFD